MKRAASAFAALAAFCTPALAHVAPWSSPGPPPLPVQFLIGIALMAVAGAVILWQGTALARGRKRRRASQDPRAHRNTGTWQSAPLRLSSGGRSTGGRRVSALEPIHSDRP